MSRSRLHDLQSHTEQERGFLHVYRTTIQQALEVYTLMNTTLSLKISEASRDQITKTHFQHSRR